MQRKCHVPGPAAEVEHLRTRTVQHLAEDAGGAVPPHPVDVHRKHMVQQIVAQQYNACRTAGMQRLGFPSYRLAIQGRTLAQLEELAAQKLTNPDEQASFRHVTSEALRVRAAVTAMEQRDAAAFGSLLLASHSSLRDRLHVSCAALDRLVEAAMDSGALGARLTGAGFGGCAVVFCRKPDLAAVRGGLIRRYYAELPAFDERMHLIHAEPGPGALQVD